MARLTEFSQLLKTTSSRRDLLRRSLVAGTAVPVVGSLLFACGGDDDDADTPAAAATEPPAAAATEPPAAAATESPAAATESPAAATDTAGEEPDADRFGGTLRVVMPSEPATLDFHIFTTGIDPSWHVYETLFSWDEGFQIAMDLAESYEASDDGLTHVIALRQGIKFHNGQEMTSADVVASIERWARLASPAARFRNALDELVAVDDYTVEARMKDPFGVVTTSLARQNGACTINPQQVMEEAGDEEVAEFIGTGPYRFVEHLPDQHVLVERFDDYVLRNEGVGGYAEAKVSYVDEIEFVPVTAEASRIAGLQAGDYHVVDNISTDHVLELEGNTDLLVEIVPPHRYQYFFLNQGPVLTGDLRIRQAIRFALNLDEIARSAYGEERYYRFDPGLVMREQTAWHTTVGEEHYNVFDPDAARALLEEAGYDGTALRFMVRQDNVPEYNASVAAVQNLEDVGFTVEHLAFDSATVLDLQTHPDAWDITLSQLSFRPDPAMNPLTMSIWPHEETGWSSDAKLDIVGRFTSTADFEERRAIFEELQELFYDEIPFIRGAEGFEVRGSRANVRGLSFNQMGGMYWNVWLENE